MKDPFLLDKKIERKNERLLRLKKFKKALIGKVERDEKERAEKLAG